MVTRVTFTHRPKRSEEGDTFIIRVISLIKNGDDDDQTQAGKAANHFVLREVKRQLVQAEDGG